MGTGLGTNEIMLVFFLFLILILMIGVAGTN